MKSTILFIIVLITVISCRKEIDPYHQTTPTAQNIDTYDEAAEELQYQLDETDDEEDNQYQPEAILMKVQTMLSADSLPYYASLDPTITKKQKYGRRQIINDTGATTVRLYGYGFKPQTADSKVLCRIKNDTVGYATITSWNDSAITCQIPTLLPLYNNKFFSLKFKVFRQNDNPLKLPVSRSKSRGCISRTLAVTARSGSTSGTGNNVFYCDVLCSPFTATQLIDSTKTLRQSYGLNPNTANAVAIDSSYIPQKGDILGRSGYTASAVDTRPMATVWCIIVSTPICQTLPIFEEGQRVIYTFNCYSLMGSSSQTKIRLSKLLKRLDGTYYTKVDLNSYSYEYYKR